jgi:HK97 family phage prohead protease
MANKMQKKHLIVPFVIKDGGVDESNPDYYEFSGYGSTFGNADLMDDVIMPGAFTESLSKRMPKMLYCHKMDMLPPGVFVEAREDANGLFLRGRLPKNVSISRDVGELMKFGAVNSMSIGFRLLDYNYDKESGITYMNKVDLWEVSVVGIPANPKAMITSVKNEGLNSLPIDIEKVKEIASNRELEEILRESGVFSKSAAIYLAGRFNIQARSESADVGEKGLDYKGLREEITQMTNILKKP